MGAGELKELIAFDARSEAETSYGVTIGEWDEQFRVASGFTYLQGGEDVMAQRIQGTQPIVIKVRDSYDTRQITTEWRARDVRRSTVFNIRGVKPSKDRGYLDILVLAGVAA